MHKLSIPDALVERVKKRTGRTHPFETIDPEKTAFVVIDMQNYFVHPDYLGAAPMAREIVPNINRLAEAVRQAGGHVVWVKNIANGTAETWSVFHDWLMTPERRETRLVTMDLDHDGCKLWHLVDAKPEDGHIAKTLFSAFLQGSSEIESYLLSRGIDTLLIGGTATNVCCESSARDAMMLNFKVVMVHDALAAFTDEAHNATLQTFYSIFGDVQSIDEVIEAMKRGAAKKAA